MGRELALPFAVDLVHELLRLRGDVKGGRLNLREAFVSLSLLLADGLAGTHATPSVRSAQ
jgi:hypothetical protein